MPTAEQEEIQDLGNGHVGVCHGRVGVFLPWNHEFELAIWDMIRPSEGS